MPTLSKKILRRVRATGVILAATLGLLTVSAPTMAAVQVHRETVTMTDFDVQPETLRWRVGEAVELVIRNRGDVGHERWAAGRGLIDTPYEKAFRTDLLAVLKPELSGRGYKLERLMTTNLDTPALVEKDAVTRLSQEMDIRPGGEVTLRFTVPSDAKGKWQMGCFLPGQYESGMYGTILIQ
jgi:uncharacterized cupredoxin-like copper-binding protein